MHTKVNGDRFSGRWRKGKVQPADDGVIDYAEGHRYVGSTGGPQPGITASVADVPAERRSSSSGLGGVALDAPTERHT